MNLITVQRIRQILGPLAGFSLFGVLMALCILASTAQGQTATYSDSFVVDNSGVTYDPEEDAWVFPQEPGPPSVVVGVGVTDANYDSWSESIVTTLSGPGGSVSDMSVDSPSGRVEVTLAPTDTGNDDDYTVQTVHRYWQDPPILAAGPKCLSNRPCIQQAAYRGSPPLSFYEVFTEAVIKVGVYRSNYQYTGRWTIPPPAYIAKLCWMRKICGWCGSNNGIAQVFAFQSCPNYIAVEFLRTWIPWGGQYCAMANYEVGVLRVCH